MPQWTDEQRKAIDVRDSNVLLSAAAGSGKTTVLVERVMQLLRAGANIDRMLIVTFTRAASADMKEKLAGAIAALAKEEPRFRRQMMLLERASISTLHSFCSDFLRSNFETADIDPSFRLVGDSELNDMVERAMDQAMEEAYAESAPDTMALNAGNGPKKVREMAMILLNALNDQPDPEGWLDSVCGQGEDLRALWINEIRDSTINDLRRAVALMREILENPGCNENYEFAITADIPRLEELILTGNTGYDPLQRALSDFSFTKTPSKRKNISPVSEDVVAMTKQARNIVSKLPIRNIPLEPALRDIEALTPALQALGRITMRAREILIERKRARAILTYNDLEHFTIRALRDDAVAESVRAMYDYIFVDEYQDTSNLQEAIIRRIVRENNLFMVGDVKQSIYRFRKAEPSLFRSKYEAYGRGMGGTLLHLTRNFRSCPAILDFTNHVFEFNMHGGDTEIVYDENARLNHGNKSLTDGNVEIHLLKSPDKNDDNDEIAESRGCDMEAVFTALKIKEMRAADKSLNYSDICVLSRSGKGVLSRMAMIMMRLGIPSYAEGTESYYESLEVQLAFALLKLVRNRRNDIELIGVLHSPIVALNCDELAEIRAAYPKFDYCDAAEHYYREHDDSIARRLKEFYTGLDRWRELSGCTDLGYLVRTILREGGVYNCARVLPSPARRTANLDSIVAAAAAFDRDLSGSFTLFLSSLERKRARGEVGDVAVVNQNDDVVQLMTIHKSKGLEFRVVFGVMMCGKLDHPEGLAPLNVHRDLGLACLYTDPELRSRRKTIARTAIALRARREAYAEELRILYVMLTRAKETLILVGNNKDPQAMVEKPAAAGDSHSYMDAILAAFPNGPKDKFTMTLHTEPYIISKYEEVPEAKAGSNEIIEEDPELTAALAWVYPYAADADLPLKLSVSGVLRQIHEPSGRERFESRPAFMATSASRMTGTERGTAYHRVMQCLETEKLRGLTYTETKNEVMRQLEALRDAKRLLPIQYDAIKPTVPTRFLCSEIGKRMLASEEIHREWSFNVLMNIADALTLEERGNWGDGEIMVQGTIDACFLENGTWVLLDYKTDRETDAEALTDRYADQLRMYAYALTKSTGYPVSEIHLCLLMANENIAINLH